MISNARRAAFSPLGLSALAGLVIVGLSSQSATAAGNTVLTAETFAGATTATSDWVLPTSAGGSTITNSACLTASATTAGTPIPGCSATALDAPGAGALRLTTNTTRQVGSVFSATSIPSSKGLDINFTSYQWSKNAGRLQAGDGIAFVLAATDPTNPSQPAVLASQGGALGYALDGKSTPGTIKPGVSYGYMGLGLDVYGNFSYTLYGNNCPGAGEIAGTNAQASNGGAVYATANAVTVRGPGNDTTGYCELPTTADTGNPYLAGYSTSGVASGLLDSPAATARPTGVPVEIAINPSASTVTTDSNLSVPANSWLVNVTPQGGTAQKMVGLLPTAAELTTLGFPAGWINPATGIPYQLSYGWTSSTGASAENHEIDKESITSLNGSLPIYQLAIGDDHGGSVTPGESFVTSITPSLDAGGGSESEATTVTTTFPLGLTPPTAGFTTSAGYVCAPVGQVVSCTYAPPQPLAAGATYPALLIPMTASSAVASYRIESKVSSLDARPLDVTGPIAIAVASASASVPTVNGPTLAATGSDPVAPGALAAVLVLTGTTALTARRRARRTR